MAACVLSLLGCVATAVLWVRSYRAADALTWSTGLRPTGRVLRVYEVLFDTGTVSFLVVDLPEEHEGVRGYLHWNVLELGTLVATPPDSFWHRLRFEVSRDRLPFGDSDLVETLIRVPTWSLVFFFSVPPVIWSWWWVRNRRSRRRLLGNQCVACSYDLTGNASGTCPECGAPLPGKAST
jgi:hypothetical protein